MKIKVYCGLSITPAEVKKILPNALVAGPIGRGDLISDIKNKTHVVCIVDGVFYHNLAVTPGEILDALRSGIKVFGASSMGALRAAELAPFGMIGVGHVYEFIRSARCFEDDFLGQLLVAQKAEHAALIDLILELHQLADDGFLSPKHVAGAIEIGRSYHFAERDMTAIIRKICDNSLFASIRTPLFRKLSRARSFKKSDGLQLLRVIKKYQTEIKNFNRVNDDQRI